MNTTDATRMLRQAEHAYGTGNFAHTLNLLDRISTDRPGLPVDDRASYDALRALLAERAGNWPEAVHCWLAVFGTTPPASGEDQPCELGCDCDVRTVLDAPDATSGETPCLCCPAHALWRLVWQAARRGAIGEVLDAVPDPSGNRRTALVHALAVGTLRSLAQSEKVDPAHAVFAIAVWHLLLDDEDPLGFEDMLTARRGAPLDAEDWQSACDTLRGRIRTAFHSVDERDGRDVLDAWETVWNVEEYEYSGELVRGERAYLRTEGCFGQCANDQLDFWDEDWDGGLGCQCDVDTWQPPTPDTAPPCLGLLLGGRPWTGSPVIVDTAAEQLEAYGEHRALLATYTRRHGEPATWQADSDTHRASAPHLASALATRAREQFAKGEWQDALTDLTSAARLGLELDRRHHEMARKAGLSAGRNGNGYQRATLVERIFWLESAHALAPDDTALAQELAAALVRRGTEVLGMEDRNQGRARFQRALCVRPGDPVAQDALDALDLADIASVVTGNRPGRQPGLQRVGELLHRGFRAENPAEDLHEVYSWYCDRMIERTVRKALAGKKSEACRVLRQLEEVRASEDERGEQADDGDIARLLLDTAVRQLGARSGDYTRQVPLLLSAAASCAQLTGAEAERQALETVLPCAAELVDSGRFSELITLQGRLLITPGRSAEYDQLVAVAYHRRARDRRADGDLAGAVRDERAASALGLTTGWQTSLPLEPVMFPSLFDSPGPPDPDDPPYIQETL
ncbi:hypothetical protein [Streptomyces flavofungini]|uniref:Tetratricopeptide repeat protein n=1 Tax=Streptomyces flavofungini TaxID=68200 RepID=A0ABS0XAG5_9ACTN|nr:hypothetical protein [Streptomyces flavofungini]MBJ3810195.1 hypothetical protein [Streptomyces flavofungini]GHC82090.1 hypothetical protein GCM10010349_65790 [Streptomyces flavofungini]